MNDDDFKFLLDYFNYSWSGYRKVRKGVKKRIVRHMQETGCRHVYEYLAKLSDDPKLSNECEQLLTVSISRFFREKKLWEGLEKEILPNVISEFGDKIEVLSAGCARGEEIYSLKILWSKLNNPVKMTATALDLNREYVTAAKEGIYGRASLKELPPELIEKYFLPARGRHKFEILPELKSDIIWQIADLADGLSGSKYHLIFLRNNILTYLNESSKHDVFYTVMESLLDNGWMIIGSHEKLPKHPYSLIRHLSIPWAYQKKVNKL